MSLHFWIVLPSHLGTRGGTLAVFSMTGAIEVLQSPDCTLERIERVY